MTPIPDAQAGIPRFEDHEPLNGLAPKVIENSNDALRRMIHAAEMADPASSAAMGELARQEWEEGANEITGGMK